MLNTELQVTIDSRMFLRPISFYGAGWGWITAKSLNRLNVLRKISQREKCWAPFHPPGNKGKRVNLLPGALRTYLPALFFPREMLKGTMEGGSGHLNHCWELWCNVRLSALEKKPVLTGWGELAAEHMGGIVRLLLESSLTSSWISVSCAILYMTIHEEWAQGYVPKPVRAAL